MVKKTIAAIFSVLVLSTVLLPATPRVALVKTFLMAVTRFLAQQRKRSNSNKQ